jgi:hypothetical protein
MRPRGLLVIPRQPPFGMLSQGLGAPSRRAEIVEGVDRIEAAALNEAHEQIADSGAVLGLVIERVFAVQDRHFERPLTDIIVQRRSGLVEKQGQFGPMLEHLVEGLAQAGVGFDLLLVELALHPLLQALQDGRATRLVEDQPFLGREFGLLGLGFVLEHFLQAI